MDWFVFLENYGLVFQCFDDTEGEGKVLEFLTGEMLSRYGVSPNDDMGGYWVVRGQEKTFVPPSSKGSLC